MCLLDVIVYIANGEIDRPIFIVACSNRYHDLVTSKDDWAEYWAMHLQIFHNYIQKANSVSLNWNGWWWRHMACFHAQLPDMKSWKWWTPSMVSSWKECIIKFMVEAWIGQKVEDWSMRILEPDVIIGFHPWGNFADRFSSIILQASRLPRDVTKRSCIDCIVHPSAGGKGWCIIISSKRSCSEAKYKVDVTSRHLVTMK